MPVASKLTPNNMSLVLNWSQRRLGAVMAFLAAQPLNNWKQKRNRSAHQDQR
jgi:hypothetical protein